MIRGEKFLISRRPYAVDLDSYRVNTVVHDDHRPVAERTFHRVTVDAVWFRRRSGVTVSVIGYLWGSIRGDESAEAPTVHEALPLLDDGRYGGSWRARWDGDSYASESPADPDDMAADLAVLRPMLENYPALPDGYDGWWRYPTSAELRAAFEARRAERAA